MMSGYAELPVGTGQDIPRLAKPFRQVQLAAAIAGLMADPPRAAERRYRSAEIL